MYQWQKKIRIFIIDVLHFHGCHKFEKIIFFLLILSPFFLLWLWISNAEDYYQALRMDIASDRKPYFCDYNDCLKAFATSNGLAMHKGTHLHGKRLTCDVDGCLKTFATHIGLAMHRSLHSVDNRLANSHAMRDPSQREDVRWCHEQALLETAYRRIISSIMSVVTYLYRARLPRVLLEINHWCVRIFFSLMSFAQI